MNVKDRFISGIGYYNPEFVNQSPHLRIKQGGDEEEGHNRDVGLCRKSVRLLSDCQAIQPWRDTIVREARLSMLLLRLSRQGQNAIICTMTFLSARISELSNLEASIVPFAPH